MAVSILPISAGVLLSGLLVLVFASVTLAELNKITPSDADKHRAKTAKNLQIAQIVGASLVTILSIVALAEEKKALNTNVGKFARSLFAQ
jgi:hypothetical protein